MSHLILLPVIVCVHFYNEIERFQLKKLMKCFSILQPIKNDVKFEYVTLKMSDFVSFPIFEFNLVIKLTNFDFKSN